MFHRQTARQCLRLVTRNCGTSIGRLRRARFGVPHLFFMKQEDILPGEEFRPVVGHCNYLVSNFGRIYSLRRRRSKGGFLKIQTNLKGYKHVGLTKEGREITATVHRIVCMAFLENPDNLPAINHKDGKKANNFVSNLEWCTNSENLQHALEAGLRIPPKNEKHWNAKLSNEDVINIKKRLANGERAYMILKGYNVSYQCILDIKNRRRWANI